MGALSRANRAALAAVRAAAERDRPRDLARIAAVLAAAGADADPAMLVAATAAAAPLTINFHPDRLLADGRPVARALLDEGVYRTQFETRISNGGLTAYPGGDRDRWEQALFAGAYQKAGVAPAERPRYGGLNLIRPQGPLAHARRPRRAAALTSDGGAGAEKSGPAGDLRDEERRDDDDRRRDRELHLQRRGRRTRSRAALGVRPPASAADDAAVAPGDQQDREQQRGLEHQVAAVAGAPTAVRATTARRPSARGR